MCKCWMGQKYLFPYIPSLEIEEMPLSCSRYSSRLFQIRQKEGNRLSSKLIRNLYLEDDQKPDYLCKQIRCLEDDQKPNYLCKQIRCLIKSKWNNRKLV